MATDSNAFRLELDEAIKEAHGAIDAVVQKFNNFLEVRVNELTPEAPPITTTVAAEPPVNQTLADATTSVISDSTPDTEVSAPDLKKTN